MRFAIGGNAVGPGQQVYIAFEIGGTMSGLVSAMKLVEVAANAGADAIKVQILNPNRLIGGDPQVAFTDSEGVKRTEPQKDALARRWLPEELWLALAQACRERNLDFIATVDVESSLTTALKAEAAAIKICSGDITNLDWIRLVAANVARRNIPVLLDTGHADLGELERAIDIVTDTGVPCMVHHVAGGYPASIERVNLAGIPVLAALFPEVAIGYSSHVEAWTIDAAAVALGVHMVEKNLTLDRRKAGPEQSSAIEPANAYEFVQAMHTVQRAMGNVRKRILPAERDGRAAARRCAWLRSPAPKGTVIAKYMLEYRRPAVQEGFEPPDERFLIGRTLGRDLPVGPILWSDL